MRILSCHYWNTEAHSIMPMFSFLQTLLLQHGSFILWHSNRVVSSYLFWINFTTVALRIRTMLLLRTYMLFYYLTCASGTSTWSHSDIGISLFINAGVRTLYHFRVAPPLTYYFPSSLSLHLVHPHSQVRDISYDKLSWILCSPILSDGFTYVPSITSLSHALNMWLLFNLYSH